MELKGKISVDKKLCSAWFPVACNSLLFTQIQSNSLSFLACSLYADTGFCFAFEQKEKLLRVWGSWAWLRPLVGQAVLSAQQLCDRSQGSVCFRLFAAAVIWNCRVGKETAFNLPQPARAAQV